MRFGLFVPQGWRFDLVGIPPAAHWETMREVALHAESGPWDSVWVYDHFHTSPQPSTQATHEAWALMAGLAAVTRRVRLGQMCTCVGYRPPMYLAKAAATTDLISGGRLEMGIGAGWYEHEWRAYGYGFPRAGARLEMLEEGVQIMRQAWRDGIATLHGKHLEVDGALCHPLPLQDGGIPLWIAGGGERVTLRIAAQHADYTNFDGTPAAFARKSAVLREHCEAVGRDFGAITRSANFNVMIGRDAAEVRRRRDDLITRLTPLLSPAQLEAQLRSFDSLPCQGTPAEIVRNLRELAGLGLGYAILYFPEAAYDRSGMEMFASEVIPHL